MNFLGAFIGGTAFTSPRRGEGALFASVDVEVVFIPAPSIDQFFFAAGF